MLRKMRKNGTGKEEIEEKLKKMKKEKRKIRKLRVKRAEKKLRTFFFSFCFSLSGND